MTTVTDIVYWA